MIPRGHEVARFELGRKLGREVARLDFWAVVVRRHAFLAPVGTRASRS